jgi:hypothetical protein
VDRRRFLSLLASGAGAVALPIAGRAAALGIAPVVHIHLLETLRSAATGADFRFLLLREVGANGDRFAQVLDIGGIWPNPVSFIAERAAAIEQFELLDPAMRWLVRGEALDGSGRTPAIAPGQTAVIWTIPGVGSSPPSDDPANGAAEVLRPGHA